MVRHDRFPGGAALCGFDELRGIFVLLRRTSVQVGGLIGPVADQSVFVKAHHDFVPEPRPWVFELIGVIEIRRNGDDDDQQQADGQTRGAEASPPPSRYPASEKDIPCGKTNRRKHDPQIGRASCRERV